MRFETPVVLLISFSTRINLLSGHYVEVHKRNVHVRKCCGRGRLTRSLLKTAGVVSKTCLTAIQCLGFNGTDAAVSVDDLLAQVSALLLTVSVTPNFSMSQVHTRHVPVLHIEDDMKNSRFNTEYKVPR